MITGFAFWALHMHVIMPMHYVAKLKLNLSHPPVPQLSKRGCAYDYRKDTDTFCAAMTALVIVVATLKTHNNLYLTHNKLYLPFAPQSAQLSLPCICSKSKIKTSP